MSTTRIPIRPRRLRRLLAAMAAGGVLAAVGIGYATEAHAAGGAFVRTDIAWGGADCIALNVAYTGETRSVCNAYGVYSYTEGNVWPGDAIGVDPVMGAASYIACSTYVNGVYKWSDFAAAGDGTDANCVGVKL